MAKNSKTLRRGARVRLKRAVGEPHIDVHIPRGTVGTIVKMEEDGEAALVNFGKYGSFPVWTYDIRLI